MTLREPPISLKNKGRLKKGKTNMMNFLSTAFKSRTIVALTLLLAVVNIPEVQALVPKGELTLVTNLLAAYSIYFRYNAQAKL